MTKSQNKTVNNWTCRVFVPPAPIGDHKWKIPTLNGPDFGKQAISGSCRRTGQHGFHQCAQHIVTDSAMRKSRFSEEHLHRQDREYYVDATMTSSNLILRNKIVLLHLCRNPVPQVLVLQLLSDTEKSSPQVQPPSCQISRQERWFG